MITKLFRNTPVARVALCIGLVASGIFMLNAPKAAATDVTSTTTTTRQLTAEECPATPKKITAELWTIYAFAPDWANLSVYHFEGDRQYPQRLGFSKFGRGCLQIPFKLCGGFQIHLIPALADAPRELKGPIFDDVTWDTFMRPEAYPCRSTDTVDSRKAIGTPSTPGTPTPPTAVRVYPAFTG